LLQAAYLGQVDRGDSPPMPPAIIRENRRRRLSHPSCPMH
jgi:hypothetical protein